jgi:hypothetical protein
MGTGEFRRRQFTLAGMVMARPLVGVMGSESVEYALPGREGTRTELALALHYRKPMIAYLGPGGEIAHADRTALPAVANTLDDVTAFVGKYLPR